MNLTHLHNHIHTAFFTNPQFLNTKRLLLPLCQDRHTLVNPYRRVLSFCRQAGSMAQSSGKKFVQIDVTSDSVCPWCFVGKKNLDLAIAFLKDKYDFEIRWHPYLLAPDAPKEGVNKKDYYRSKFGARSEQIVGRMTDIFKGLGLSYDMNGLTGSSLDSHRLILFAGKKGQDKQHKLVEELFLGYFTQGKFIGDKKFLSESATKVGIEGAAEFLEDSNNGLNEVKEELQKYSNGLTGVPNYVINGKQQLSGGQPPEVFIKAIQLSAN